MGRLGKVIKSYIARLSGVARNAQFTAVEEFAGDERKAQVFGPCNEDFSPPNNVKTINIPLGRGRGFLVSVAYNNDQITPQAKEGERRIYSTGADGTEVKAEVFLKQDGTIFIDNGNVTITATPAGELTVTTTGKSIINSLETVINNPVKITGLLTAVAGIRWGGVATGLNGLTAPVINNGLTVTGGSVTHDGVNTGKTHAHGNVVNGGDVSGGPQ